MTVGEPDARRSSALLAPLVEGVARDAVEQRDEPVGLSATRRGRSSPVMLPPPASGGYRPALIAMLPNAGGVRTGRAIVGAGISTA